MEKRKYKVSFDIEAAGKYEQLLIEDVPLTKENIRSQLLYDYDRRYKGHLACAKLTNIKIKKIS